MNIFFYIGMYVSSLAPTFTKLLYVHLLKAALYYI